MTFYGRRTLMENDKKINCIKKSMPMQELHTAPAPSRFAEFFHSKQQQKIPRDYRDTRVDLQRVKALHKLYIFRPFERLVTFFLTTDFRSKILPKNFLNKKIFLSHSLFFAKTFCDRKLLVLNLF